MLILVELQICPSDVSHLNLPFILTSNQSPAVNQPIKVQSERKTTQNLK